MMDLRGQVAIVGAADTDVGKLPHASPMQLTVEAAGKAIADAGLRKQNVDGLITCNSMAQPLMYHAEATAEYMGIEPKFCLGLGAGGGTAFAVVQYAASAILTGVCSTVVITMADSLRTGMSRERAVATQASTGHAQFELPYGPTVPTLYALIAQAHMHQFGTTPEQLAAVAVTCREHAIRNPAAQMRKPMTVEDVLASDYIADPLHLFDCSLVSDGGAAIVVTAADRAAEFPSPPVYLLGVGEGHRHEHISAAPDLVTSGAVESGQRAYAMAGMGPDAMDWAGIYDCFTPVVLVELEDLGFCEKGEGGPFVESGAVRYDGSLPMNTHGGLLSHCHSGNPGSMFALTEAITQLRGNAGDRQVPGMETALVHAQGGILSSHCTLILGTGATL